MKLQKMNKRRSIFSKYFAICSAVILISFCCLGAVLLLVSSRYFLEDKKDMLCKNAVSLSKHVQENMLERPDGWKEGLREEIEKFSISSGADFVLCSADGTIIESSGEIGNIEQKYLENFGSDGDYIYGDLGGNLPGKNHIIGVSFQGSGPMYYVLAYASKTAQDDYMKNIVEIFLISAAVAMAAVICLVYYATVKLTEPIKEIAEVSKKIGEGDFSVVLPEYNIMEYQQLSAAFNEMAASLKGYDTMRSSFLANVSHELRTPMTSIGGFVDGLLDGTIPKEEERYYLKIISSEVNRLSRLVKSMLNLAKMEAGEIEPKKEVFSMLEPILDSLVSLEEKIEKKKLEIRGLDVDRENVYADKDLIHQVVYNIIENAIKFANEGGYIEFEFIHRGEMTEICIKNSGEGLSKEELPLVFDRFYKADKSRGLEAQSLGLGLNVARSIVELHGGKIMVTSIKGEYTQFMFTLPNKAREV